MDKLNVVTDAELINSLSKKALEEPAPVIETQAPSASDVTLLAGAVVGGNLATDAEVRELNGADEEAIATSGSLGKSLATILRRGVVRIGGRPVTEDVLDSLLAGDRDYLMLAIRKVTFGKDVPVGIGCSSCGAVTEAVIDLDKDIPVKPFPGYWSWDSETKIGTVTMGFYNGLTQKRLMDNLDKTAAEISTILLAGSIQAVNGMPVIASDLARNLGMADREKLMMEILEKNPGPRLLEVKKACEACGELTNVPLSLASLFRL